MNNFLYRILPMSLSLALSQIIYVKVDRKYEVTNKVSSKLHIKPEWKASFCIGCTIISMLTIGVVNIYIINIPKILYYILNGIIMGIGVSIANKLNINKIK